MSESTSNTTEASSFVLAKVAVVGARQCDACEEEISGCDAELNSSRVGWGEQFHADAIRVDSLEMHGGAERCMHTQVLARKH